MAKIVSIAKASQETGLVMQTIYTYIKRGRVAGTLKRDSESGIATVDLDSLYEYLNWKNEHGTKTTVTLYMKESEMEALKEYAGDQSIGSTVTRIVKKFLEEERSQKAT